MQPLNPHFAGCVAILAAVTLFTPPAHAGHHHHGGWHSSFSVGIGFGFGSYYGYGHGCYRYPYSYSCYDYYPSYCYPAYYPAHYEYEPAYYYRPAPVVYEAAPRPVYRPAPLPANPPAPLDGWALLRRDKADEALRSFTDAANASPNRGLPHAGRAIALAVLGRDVEAMTAMRRAIHLDPECLGYVPNDDGTRAVLTRLAGVYRKQAQDQTGQAAADAWFLIAAMDTALRDRTEAQIAIDAAFREGDRHPTTTTLRDQLHRSQDGKWRYKYQGE